MAPTKRLRWTLRRQLILILLVIGVLPLLITGAVNIVLTSGSLRQSAIGEEQIRIRNQSDTIERFLDAPLNDLLLLSRAAPVQSLAQAIIDNNSLTLQQRRQDVEQEFENFAQERKFGTNQLYEHIRFLDHDGYELVRIDNSSGQIVSASAGTLNYRSEKDYFKSAVALPAGQIYVSPVELFDEFGRIQKPYTPLMQYSTPVYVGDALAGVVVTDVRAQGFLDAIEANNSPNSSTLLIDKNGYYLAHPDVSRLFGYDLGTNIQLQTDQPQLASILQTQQPGLIELNDSIAFYTRVVPPGQNTIYWYLVSLRPLNGLLAAVYQQQTTLILAVLLVALVVTGAALFFAQNFGRPISELTQISTEIAAGNLAQRVHVERSDELGVLANSFNSMADQLSSLITDLERRVSARTRDLETAAEVSKQVASLLDPDRLLVLLVELTRTRFNLYFTQVYTLDGQALKMIAGVSEQGSVSETELGVLPLDAEPSVIARVARTRQPQIIADTSHEPTFRFNSLAPETRAEMAVPMVVGQQLIGVLDLQSKEPNHFDEADLRAMTTLVGQVAIALENARLYAEQVEITEKLREVDRLKSLFLANMSHELRTPLNAILNFAEFIAGGILGPVNEQQLEALNKVINSGDHLLGLINDILDLTKIESGMMELFVEEVDLNEEVEQVLETVSGLSRADGVELVTDVDPQLPQIAGDRRRIRQILLNLLSNALKFTAEGSVTLHGHVEGDKVVFVVEDTGVGIAEADQALVFQSFRQGKEGLQKGSSTGLGLPISKFLAEAHGGALWLTSTLGGGTTFYVSLPLETQLVQPNKS